MPFREEVPMNRVIRDRLAALFLGAFGDRVKHEAVLWLGLCCDKGVSRGHVDHRVDDLLQVWTHRYGGWPPHPDTLPRILETLKGLMEFTRVDGAQNGAVAALGRGGSRALRVRFHVDVHPCLSAACARVRVYVKVREAHEGERSALEGMSPLHRVVAEAAYCFNAGLFFEAHEHLERQWVGLPRGDVKRFLQAIIHVSVGCHHAVRGSYDGSVNQLAKGLAKMIVPPGGPLGLDVSRFQGEVEEARRQLIHRGRMQMRPVTLDELPRMHLLG